MEKGRLAKRRSPQSTPLSLTKVRHQFKSCFLKPRRFRVTDTTAQNMEIGEPEWTKIIAEPHIWYIFSDCRLAMENLSCDYANNQWVNRYNRLEKCSQVPALK